MTKISDHPKNSSCLHTARLMEHGYSAAEVAAERELSPATVRSHIAKYRRLLRAAGGHSTPDLQAELLAALNHSDPRVRKIAAVELGRLGRRDAAKPLMKCLAREQVDGVRIVLVVALRRVRARKAVPLLEEIVADPKEHHVVRTAARITLQEFADRLEIDGQIHRRGEWGRHFDAATRALRQTIEGGPQPAFGDARVPDAPELKAIIEHGNRGIRELKELMELAGAKLLKKTSGLTSVRRISMATT